MVLNSIGGFFKIAFYQLQSFLMTSAKKHIVLNSTERHLSSWLHCAISWTAFIIIPMHEFMSNKIQRSLALIVQVRLRRKTKKTHSLVASDQSNTVNWYLFIIIPPGFRSSSWKKIGKKQNCKNRFIWCRLRCWV